MRAFAVAALLSASSLPRASAPPPAPPVQIGVASGMEKLRPGDPIPGARGIALAAARGECESAQIAVRSSAGLSALAAEARPLAPNPSMEARTGGPRSGAALEVALHRVATLALARPSGPDGAAGEWPDPLVPARDPFFGQARRAFPVAVAPGRLQAIWVEVCVPREARAGRYAGAVALRDGARRIAEIPIAVEVWPFELPSKPTFVAAFGLPTRIGTKALGAPDDAEVARALAAAALRHRITPFVLSADPPDGSCTEARCDLDWRRYDAEVAPILDGTLVAGVKGTFAEVRIPGKVWSGPERDAIATLAAWRRHFEARGWSDRLWLYTLDEPGPDQKAELARRARLAHAAGVRVFATTLPGPPLDGLVDAFAPNLTLLPDVPDPRARRGAVAFSYASCLSHGCGEIPPEGPRRAEMMRAFAGWPGYEIDRPGAAARAVAWLAWRRGLEGELYYDMLHAWTADPWSDPRAFAGNGDGTLLYPGRTSDWGGERPFPIASIRLANIRDALEDVELLRLAERAGLGPLARKLAARLVPSARGWERRPEPWLAARRELGDAVARARTH